jgi:hypothetical protein
MRIVKNSQRRATLRYLALAVLMIGLLAAQVPAAERSDVLVHGMSRSDAKSLGIWTALIESEKGSPDKTTLLHREVYGDSRWRELGLVPARVIALTDNVPLITAWANDVSYEDIFVEQLRNLVQPQDVVIGISGSGNSPNVLKAMTEARQLSAITVGFSGFSGGKLAQIVDIPVVVPSNHMGQIEDAHLILEHLISYSIRAWLEENSAS